MHRDNDGSQKITNKGFITGEMDPHDGDVSQQTTQFSKVNSGILWKCDLDNSSRFGGSETAEGKVGHVHKSDSNYDDLSETPLVHL